MQYAELGPNIGQTNQNSTTTMTSRPRRAAATVSSYDEDTLEPNSTRKRKPTEQLEPPGPSTAALSKKRAPKTANAGSLEWILTSSKSPLASLPLDVSVASMPSSDRSNPLRPSYRE